MKIYLAGPDVFRSDVLKVWGIGTVESLRTADAKTLRREFSVVFVRQPCP